MSFFIRSPSKNIQKFNDSLNMMFNSSTGRFYGIDGVKGTKEVNGYSFTKGNKKVFVRFSSKVDRKNKLHVSKSNDGKNTIWVGEKDCMDFELIRDTIINFVSTGKSNIYDAE